MSTVVYKRISYDVFRFLIYLNNLNKKLITIPIVYDEVAKNFRSLRIESTMSKLCEFKLLEKELLTKVDFLTLPDSQHQNLKFKYKLTKRAEHFINRFEPDLYVFQHYEISNRAMNVLYYLIDVNIPITFADFKEQFLSKIETCGTTTSLVSLHKNYAYIINLLVKDKLIATSINPDNERLFKITNLGRDVLDLSNRVNDFLKDEDCLQSTVRNIQTKFKTMLMFPLWT